MNVLWQVFYSFQKKWWAHTRGPRCLCLWWLTWLFRQAMNHGLCNLPRSKPNLQVPVHRNVSSTLILFAEMACILWWTFTKTCLLKRELSSSCTAPYHSRRYLSVRLLEFYQVVFDSMWEASCRWCPKYHARVFDCSLLPLLHRQRCKASNRPRFSIVEPC